MPAVEQPFQDFHSLCDLGEFFGCELVKMGSELGDAKLAAFLQQTYAFGGGADAHAAGVVGIGRDGDQAAAIQSGHDAAHGGRLDLFGGGEFAERFWSAENQHRKRGEPRRALAGGDVLLAHAAQQVDRRGMQPVGDGQNVGMRA